jgi:membrane protein DedA with SNARE-associated domain
MKEKLSLKIVITLLLLTGLTICLINYNYLSNLIESLLEKQIGNWGYYGIIISVFILEFIPQPFLSALIPFTTGLLFNLNTLGLIITMILTSIIANYAAYFLGRYYGDFTTRFFISKKNYEKSLIWFKKYGKKSITILALTPLPYFPIMGGIFKMNFKEFTLYAIIPRIFHFTIFSCLIIIFI